MYDGFVFHLNLASWRVVYFGNWIFIAIIIIIIILSMYCCCSFSLRWCFCCFFHLFSFWLLVCCFCCFSSCCLCCLRSSAFASFLPAPPPLPPPPAPPAPAPQPPQPPPPPPPKQNVIWQWIPHLWIRCVNWRTRLMGGQLCPDPTRMCELPFAALVTQVYGGRCYWLSQSHTIQSWQCKIKICFADGQSKRRF